MNNLLPLFIIILIVTLFIWLTFTKKEQLISPWEIQNCKLRCMNQGADLPWDGGEYPWKDPATTDSSNFDVSGCMAQCYLESWYI